MSRLKFASELRVLLRRLWSGRYFVRSDWVWSPGN